MYNAQGISEIYEIPQKFTSKLFISLLKKDLIPILRDRYPISEQIFILHDKSSCHTANNVKTFVQSQQNVRVIVLPVGGTDLNPIEDLWSDIFDELAADGKKTYEQLLEEVYVAWVKFITDENYLKNLSSSILRKLYRVIQLDGRKT